MKYFTFTTQGKVCTAVGLKCIDTNWRYVAPVKIEERELSGSTSPIIAINQCRNRFILTVDCVLEYGNLTPTEAYTKLLAWLGYTFTDEVIEMSFDTKLVRKGFLQNITNIVEKGNVTKLTLEFNCHPSKFTKGGIVLKKYVHKMGYSLYIDADAPNTLVSSPIIAIDRPDSDWLRYKIATGKNYEYEYTIDLNNCTQVTLGTTLYLDSSTLDVYIIGSDGNKRSIPNILQGEPPKLSGGKLKLVVDSRLSGYPELNLYIQPNWEVL